MVEPEFAAEENEGGSSGADAGTPSYHRRAGGANGPDLVVGVSSGTSMDGVDAALVAIGPGGDVELLAFRTFPYDPELRRELSACAELGSTAAVARLNVAVGEVFAEAVLDLLDTADCRANRLRCIGSHGQTLVHLPGAERVGGRTVPATLQIGELAVIAQRTGVTTVGDFRPRDLAAGGEGAPLVPLLDHRLFAHARKGRVALNLGGIANVTGLPPAARLTDVRAFDTGPGNVLLDAAARLRGLPGGRDERGAAATTGRLDSSLLGLLLDHPFYERTPPKSADTSDFLGDYADGCWQTAEQLSTADLLSTLVELTARTVRDGISRHIAAHQRVDEVIVSGGGVHNRALMEALREQLEPTPVLRADDVSSIPCDAKEALLFALLAHETLAGRAGNVPSATGASAAVPLGKIVPGGASRAPEQDS